LRAWNVYIASVT